MALKKIEDEAYPVGEPSPIGQKARDVFSQKSQKEKKILTTFSIEPSFKEELEDVFSELGLGWAAGIRFALKQFIKNRNA